MERIEHRGYMAIEVGDLNYDVFKDGEKVGFLECDDAGMWANNADGILYPFPDMALAGLVEVLDTE